MSRTLQFKRYANTAVANTTGADGELIIDTTNKTITVHNGNTVGGSRIATESFVNISLNNYSTVSNIANAAFSQANNASNGFVQNAQTGTYTLQSTDAGKYLYYTPAANVILYLPWTSNVSFTNGTTIMVVSQNTGASANIVVTPNVNVSLFTAGNTISGSHNVNPYGVATLMMVKANTWFLTGSGIT
jgi:hypothetical protein